MSINQYNGPKPAFGRAHLGAAPGAQGFGRAGYNAGTYAAPVHGSLPYSVGGGGSGSEHYGAKNGSLTPGRTVIGLRWVSGFVDLIVVSVMIFVILAIFGMIEVAVYNEEKSLQTLAVTAALAAAFFYGVILDASRWQGTVGKMATRTIVTDLEGQRISLGRSLWRNIGKVISTCVPLYIPYIMVSLTAENQTLHDMMSRVLVRKNLGDTPADNTYSQIFS